MLKWRSATISIASQVKKMKSAFPYAALGVGRVSQPFAQSQKGGPLLASRLPTADYRLKNIRGCVFLGEQKR